MKERLFLSLVEQLRHDIVFTTHVSRPYYNSENGNKTIEFEYFSKQYQLILNGDIRMKTPADDVKIESFDDLIQELIRSKRENL